VDEIVVFQDGTTPETKAGQTTEMLVHVLSYLETPPYLRKRLFPLHANLKFAGTLPPLDIPSHYRTADEGGVYREAVAVARDRDVTVIDAGLKCRVVVREEVPVGARVTVKFDSAEDGCGKEKEIVAVCVAPETPRMEAGIYWGYNVRNADSLAAVFTESPFEGGYDVTIGTSEGGEDVAGVLGGIPEFSHMLIAFGGLEQAFRTDEELVETGVAEVREIFDFWVDLCPNRASSAIRTEEAVWIALSKLGDTITRKAKKV
jgi:predicted SPOUT superfamily RNA methylase MTH1